MATTTSKDLVLHFQTVDGRDFKITIPDYKEDITDAEIKAGAADILTQGAFAPGGAPLVKTINAVKVDTVKTEIDMEEA